MMADPEASRVRLDNETVRNAASRMEEFNKKARCIEVALIGIMTAGIVFLVGADIHDRQAARKRNMVIAKQQAESAAFGLDAVQCVVGQVIDHRIADRAFFEAQLTKAGLDFHKILPDEVADDPLFPAGDRLKEACARFRTAVDDGTAPTTKGKP